MPAGQITASPNRLTRFDVVGFVSSDVPGFVRHVGLFDEAEGDLVIGTAADIAHMGPPYGRGIRSKVDVFGRVPLDNNQVNIIDTWLVKIADEYRSVQRSKQYIIHPPMHDERNPNTKVKQYRRYSCAGLVIDAYRQARIDLLVLDEDHLPDVYPETIRTAYGLKSTEELSKYGLDGPGPWRVVLAGYVIDSLSRPTHEIHRAPYQAA